MHRIALLIIFFSTMSSPVWAQDDNAPQIGDEYRVGKFPINAIPEGGGRALTGKNGLRNQQIRIIDWVRGGKYNGMAVIEVATGKHRKKIFITSKTNLNLKQVFRIYKAPRSQPEPEITDGVKVYRFIRMDIRPTRINDTEVGPRDDFIVEETPDGTFIEIVGENSRLKGERWKISRDEVGTLLRRGAVDAGYKVARDRTSPRPPIDRNPSPRREEPKKSPENTSVYKVYASNYFRLGRQRLRAEDEFVVLNSKVNGQPVIKFVGPKSRYKNDGAQILHPDDLKNLLKASNAIGTITREEIRKGSTPKKDIVAKPEPTPHKPREKTPTRRADRMGNFVGVMNYRGKRYARAVDLRRQFQRDIQTQRGGSCHVFAAVALVESFCKKEFGIELDLSEAYLFYRHLRERFSDPYVLEYLDPVITKAEAEAKVDRSDGLQKEEVKILQRANKFTDTDGGFAVNTIQRILNLDVCLEPAMPFGTDYVAKLTDFKGELNNIINEYDEKTCDVGSYEKSKIEEEMRGVSCKELDGRMACYFDESEKTDKGYKKTASDHSEIAKCIKAGNGVEMKQLSYRSDADNPRFQEKALSLLNDGKPFLCVNDYNYGEEAGGGRHVATVIGYQPDREPKKKPEIAPISFALRDSNSEKITYWTMPICEKIIWLEPRAI